LNILYINTDKQIECESISSRDKHSFLNAKKVIRYHAHVDAQPIILK